MRKMRNDVKTAWLRVNRHDRLALTKEHKKKMLSWQVCGRLIDWARFNITPNTLGYIGDGICRRNIRRHRLRTERVSALRQIGSHWIYSGTKSDRRLNSQALTSHRHNGYNNSNSSNNGDSRYTDICGVWRTDTTVC